MLAIFRMRHRVLIFVGFSMTVGVVGRGQFRLGDIAPTTEGACATLSQFATVPVAVAAAASDTQRLSPHSVRGFSARDVAPSRRGTARRRRSHSPTSTI